MILVATSVWVEHLRRGLPELAGKLLAQQVLMHPMVHGELALGNLRNRNEVLRLLGELPAATAATDDEVLLYIERHTLMGRGIGFVDAHLLAATSLTVGARLWTKDRRLAQVAIGLRMAHV